MLDKAIMTHKADDYIIYYNQAFRNNFRVAKGGMVDHQRFSPSLKYVSIFHHALIKGTLSHNISNMRK